MNNVVSAPPLDLPRLQAWLERQVTGFRGPIEARRLIAGNSNPIWRLDTGGACYILRTQPAGQLLRSAHALDREVRVMRALHGGAVPVPRIHVLCNDLDVIGVQFYLMEFLAGQVHREVALTDVAPERRPGIYHAALETLAAIHRSDIAALGLRDFGRTGNYFERQLHRWTKQYRSALPEGLPEMDELIGTLTDLLPKGEHPNVLIHGDCRLDNLMFAPGGHQVIAVLDWELSTLGHPLADLGQFLGVQELPPDYLLPGLAGIDRRALNIPEQREMTRHYLNAMHWPVDADELDMRFYKAFAMFRQAAMSAGLLRRALAGTAVNETALAFGQSTGLMARVGLQILAADDTRDPQAITTASRRQD